MDGKQSVSRRVSASTTAPRAPYDNSSHMNQKRSCPGVPNRYTTSPSRMVIRPKSIATVVVVFPSTPSVSSTPMPRSESTSSVRRGRISLIAPTSVVLPTPKPPATRILRATGSSEGAKAIDHFLENALAWQRRHLARVPYVDEPEVVQIPQQDTDHAQRQAHLGRDVRHGGPPARDVQDAPLLGGD